MKILLWHGYLLGGTGSNVYTRSLARAWSRLGHEVVVFCQEPHPERFDLGGAAFVRPDMRAAAPGLRPRPLRGPRAAAPARSSARPSAARSWSGTPPRCGSTCRPTSCFVNHVLLGGAGRRRHGRAVHGQGARLRARVLDPRQRGARGVGAGEPRRRRRRPRRLGAHPARARGGRRPGRLPGAGASRPAGSRRRGAPAASRAPRRSPRLLEEARRDPPRVAASAIRTGQRGAARGVPRRGRADRRLRREAERREGCRACSSRRSSGVGRARGRRRLRAGARRARGGGGRPRVLFTGPLEHRHLRHLLAARRRRASRRRSSRRRSAWWPPRRPPAARRRSSRAIRASPRSPKGSRPSTRPSIASSPRSRTATSTTCAAKLAAILRSRRPSERRLLRGRARGARQSRSGAGSASPTLILSRRWVTPSS